MEKLVKILELIEATGDCTVSKHSQPVSIDIAYDLPEDLRYYLGNYDSIVFFEHAPYTTRIVGKDEFERANPVIVGEDAEDDISYHWYIIADSGNSQYITIDLRKERSGYCYDSFWEIHGLVGDQPVIAKSFTELLVRLHTAKGGYWYWRGEGFPPYGDAYDE